MGYSSFPSAKKLQSPKVIKKYGNRKLYDTEQSSYVVLKDIEKMVRNKEDIQVIDNETESDITISTLTQIIFSSEKKSKVSPPIHVLKSIIREGDGSFSAFLAKLGLFEVSERGAKNDHKASSHSAGDLPRGKKKDALEKTQSLEQKITSLISSGDSGHDDTVPELPGNRLS